MANSFSKTVETDGSGRYVSDGLAAGVYRVTLVVNGAVKASIRNTETKADQRTQLNFDLKPGSASRGTGTTIDPTRVDRQSQG